jgi:hypothetical protein
MYFCIGVYDRCDLVGGRFVIGEHGEVDIVWCKVSIHMILPTKKEYQVASTTYNTIIYKTRLYDKYVCSYRRMTLVEVHAP